MKIMLRKFFLEASALPKSKPSTPNANKLYIDKKRANMVSNLKQARDPKNGKEGKEVAKLIRKYDLSSTTSWDRSPSKVKENFDKAKKEAQKKYSGVEI